MSIEPHYQHMYDQARQMQNRIHDSIGDHNHPMAHVIDHEMRGLMDDMEMNRHPRDIENRIKNLQHQMQQVEHQGQHLMTVDHAVNMHHDFEHMRRTVRTFHNY